MAPQPVISDHEFVALSAKGIQCGFDYGAGTGLCLRRKEDHVLYSNGISPKPENMSHGETVFLAYSEAVQRLIRTKDQAYGGAWQKQGYMGNLARIMSKTERLKNMAWTDSPAVVEALDESVLDTLKDLMALCAFMAANIEDGNRWGR